MNYNFEDNNELYKNTILSTTKPSKTILKTGLEQKVTETKRLKQKSIIKVYIKDNTYYIEHATAYALGLINTRSIMLEGPKLVKITPDTYNKLKSNENIEIELINIKKKQPIKVFIDNQSYCIHNSSAYALGLLSNEEWSNADSDYYYINDDILNNLKNNYEVEYYSLNLEDNTTNKKI